MQRQDPEGVVICCDFCATDWDGVSPMIEGHKGSVICLPCLNKSLDEADAAPSAFACTLCLHDRAAGERGWLVSSTAGGVEAKAVCQGCIDQAARAFSKDPDVDWKDPRK